MHIRDTGTRTKEVAPRLHELASSYSKRPEHEDTYVEQRTDRGTGCCWGDAPSLSTTLGTPVVAYTPEVYCTFRTVQVYAGGTGSAGDRSTALHLDEPWRQLV